MAKRRRTQRQVPSTPSTPSTPATADAERGVEHGVEHGEERRGRARDLAGMDGAASLDDHLDDADDVRTETAGDAASAELDPADAGKRLKRNILWNYGSGITSLVALVLLFPIAVRLGGAHEYGLWVLIFGVSQLLGMTDFGLADGVVRLLGAMTRDGAPLRQRRQFMTVSVSMFLSLAAVSTLIYAVATPLYLSTVDTSSVPTGAEATLVVLGGFAMIFAILGRAMNCILWSQDRQDIERKCNIAGVALRCIGYVLVYFLGGGILGVAIAEVVGSCVIPLVCTIAVARRFHGFELTRAAVREYGKPLFKLSSSLFVGSFAMMLTFQVPLYVVGSALGLLASTAFASIIRVYTAARLVNSWMADPFIHRITSSDEHRLGRTLRTPYLMTGLVGGTVAIVVGALGGDLLEAWMGQEFAFAGTAMQVLGLGIIADAVIRPAIHVVNLRGNPWRIARLNVSVLVLTTVAVWAASRSGSLTVVVLACVLVPLAAVPFYIVAGSRITGEPPIPASRYVLLVTLLAGVVLFAVLYAVGQVLTAWPALLVGGLVCVGPAVLLLREVRRARAAELGRHRRADD